MDKRIKLFGALAIAFLLLVTPASANIWLTITSTEVHVNYQDNWDAAVLTTNSHSMAWAQSVINCAKAHGTTPTRSQGDIATEIRWHARAYLLGERGSSNPADIGVTERDGAFWG